MNNRKILTIQQIIESEKKFIAEFSEEIILNTAGKKIAVYLKKYYADKKIFLSVVMETTVMMVKSALFF